LPLICDSDDPNTSVAANTARASIGRHDTG